MKRIWGFDLGTACVGFAVVGYDQNLGSVTPERLQKKRWTKKRQAYK